MKTTCVLNWVRKLENKINPELVKFPANIFEQRGKGKYFILIPIMNDNEGNKYAKINLLSVISLPQYKANNYRSGLAEIFHPCIFLKLISNNAIKIYEKAKQLYSLYWQV